MSDTPSDFLDLFKEEAAERLDNMVSCVLALERGDPPAKTIENLFREAHTIKGAAGMLGLHDVHDLAHVLEDLLSDVRDSGVFPDKLADPLLQGVDMMRRLIGGAHESTAELIAELVVIRADVRGVAGDLRSGTDFMQRAAQAVAVVPPVTLQSSSPSGGIVTEPRSTVASPPRRSVHVAADKIDRLLDLVSETTLHQSRLQFVLGHEAGPRREVLDELDAGDRLLDELKTTAIGLRTVPLSSVLGGFPRSIRDLAHAEGKDVELVLEGIETELDRTIVESLPDVLTHVLRNAIAHGIESPEDREDAGKPARGVIRLKAQQRGSEVEIAILDDGRGISQEILDLARDCGSLAELLSSGGFSSAETVTELAGRGVGLDAVRSRVEAFGGRLEIQSEPGRGTAVILLLPLSLALLEVLLVERGAEAYGIPLFAMQEVLAVGDHLSLEGRFALDLRGASVPLFDLATVIGATARPLAPGAPAAIVMIGTRRAALACDHLLGQQEIVVKPLGLFAPMHGYLGGAILGDGRIALLIDPMLVFESDRRAPPEAITAVSTGLPVAPKIMVVEDFLTARELQRSILEAAGYRVVTAVDGQDALDQLKREDDIALVVTDVEMPVMNGLILTETIRARSPGGSLPVIIVTTRDSEEDRRRGLEAGADAYLTKRGFSQQTLLEAVERLIGR